MPGKPPRCLLLLLLGLAALACAGKSVDPRTPRRPTTIAVTRDVPYAERGGRELVADLYRPVTGRRPGVVVIHAGGWFSGSKDDVAGLAQRLADAGYVAMAPGYRLAPEHRFPAQIHDLKEAVRWLRANADEWGVDPERIAAFGYSAGGHLAALLATSGPDDGLEGETAFPGTSSRVQALVAGGTPADLLALRPNPAVAQLLGAQATERPTLAASASPVRFVSADDPPAFLYHGRSDWLISTRQSRLLHRALERAGVPVRLELGRFGHFGTLLFGGREEGLAIDFLARSLAPQAEPRMAGGAPAPRS
jgi:acetyl esterase/lipase